jgi:hypothetical protein
VIEKKGCMGMGTAYGSCIGWLGLPEKESKRETGKKWSEFEMHIIRVAGNRHKQMWLAKNGKKID